MKIAVGLALAALATSVPALAGPGRLDASKRAPRLSTDEKAVLPENQPIKRDEVVQDKRFEGKTYEKKEAIVGERRSTITVEERRDKKFFNVPEQNKFGTNDVIERKDNAWAGKMSRYSTSEDAYRSKMAVRFQDKISEASPFGQGAKPVVTQRTTFDKINRFVFRKNSDQSVGVTTAGSERPAADASSTYSPGKAVPATGSR